MLYDLSREPPFKLAILYVIFLTNRPSMIVLPGLALFTTLFKPMIFIGVPQLALSAILSVFGSI